MQEKVCKNMLINRRHEQKSLSSSLALHLVLGKNCNFDGSDPIGRF